MKNTILILLILLWLLPIQSQISNNPLNKPATVSVSSPVAFSVNAAYSQGEPFPNNTLYRVKFNQMLFDEGNNFYINNNEFVAPVNGIYHFMVRVNFKRFSRNGSVVIQLNHTTNTGFLAFHVQPASVTEETFDGMLNTLLKLNAGEKVAVVLNQTTTEKQEFRLVKFSGYKIN